MQDRVSFWVLDVIRFTLGLYLLIFHSWHWYPELRPYLDVFRIFGLGNLATSVFFILSGFLLTHVYLSGRSSRKIDTEAFFSARLSTIYPLHIAGIVLTVPKLALAAWSAGGLMVAVSEFSDAQRAMTAGEIGFALLSHLTLSHAWLLDFNYLLFNFPSWSLSALMFFYLLFPYVAPRLVQLRSPLLWICVIGIIFSIPGFAAHFGLIGGPLVEGIMHHHPVVRLPLFLAGILLYAIYRSRQADPRGVIQSRASRLALHALIVAGAAIGMYYYAPSAVFPLLRNGLFYPVALAIVWLAVTTRLKLGDRWRAPVARLAKSSLSIFILHIPLYGLLVRSEQFIHALLLEEGGLNFKRVIARAADLAPMTEMYPVHLLLIVGLSIVMQERFANPAQSWLRNAMRPKMGAPVMPVAGAGQRAVG